MDYAAIFFPDLAIILSKNSNINKHIIELIKNKQPFYIPISSLNQVKLEILKF